MNNKFILIILSVLVIVILLAVFLPSDTKFPSKLSDIYKKDSNKSVFPDNNFNYKAIDNTKTSVINKIKNTLNIGQNQYRNIPIDVCFSPEENCELKLIELIDSSKKSIDCAIYDITLDGIADSLTSSKENGTNIRIVSEYKSAKKKSSTIGKLKSSDISLILDPDSSSLMHNKFCVFDDKIVWVGSMNFTLNGNYKNNNNSVIIEDKEVAELFKDKIDSFFLGNFSQNINYDTDIRKIGNTEIYFCPEDDCKEQVIRYLKDTNKSLDCMFFSFTLDDITMELEELTGIKKRFIFEDRTIDNYSEYNNLVDLNIPAIKDKNPNTMHNKLCIFDNRIVMTGSMNMSRNGTENNDESLVFIDDPKIANKYTDYFNKYWNLWNN